MIAFINQIVLGNIDKFSVVISALLIAAIGTPFVSFEGGIPRMKGKIVNAEKSLLLFIGVGLLMLFVVGPLVNVLITELIKKYVDFTIPVLALLGGVTLWQWDGKMRFSYKKYWISLLVIGIILALIELKPYF